MNIERINNNLAEMFEEIKIELVGALIQRPIVSKANNNGSAVLFSFGKCTFVPGDESSPLRYINQFLLS